MAHPHNSALPTAIRPPHHSSFKPLPRAITRPRLWLHQSPSTAKSRACRRPRCRRLRKSGCTIICRPLPVSSSTTPCPFREHTRVRPRILRRRRDKPFERWRTGGTKKVKNTESKTFVPKTSRKPTPNEPAQVRREQMKRRRQRRYLYITCTGNINSKLSWAPVMSDRRGSGGRAGLRRVPRRLVSFLPLPNVQCKGSQIHDERFASWAVGVGITIATQRTKGGEDKWAIELQFAWRNEPDDLEVFLFDFFEDHHTTDSHLFFSYVSWKPLLCILTKRSTTHHHEGGGHHRHFCTRYLEMNELRFKSFPGDQTQFIAVLFMKYGYCTIGKYACFATRPSSDA